MWLEFFSVSKKNDIILPAGKMHFLEMITLNEIAASE